MVHMNWFELDLSEVYLVSCSEGLEIDPFQIVLESFLSHFGQGPENGESCLSAMDRDLSVQKGDTHCMINVGMAKDDSVDWRTVPVSVEVLNIWQNSESNHSLLVSRRKKRFGEILASKSE